MLSSLDMQRLASLSRRLENNGAYVHALVLLGIGGIAVGGFWNLPLGLVMIVVGSFMLAFTWKLSFASPGRFVRQLLAAGLAQAAAMSFFAVIIYIALRSRT